MHSAFTSVHHLAPMEVEPLEPESISLWVLLITKLSLQSKEFILILPYPVITSD